MTTGRILKELVTQIVMVYHELYRKLKTIVTRRIGDKAWIMQGMPWLPIITWRVTLSVGKSYSM